MEVMHVDWPNPTLGVIREWLPGGQLAKSRTMPSRTMLSRVPIIAP